MILKHVHLCCVCRGASILRLGVGRYRSFAISGERCLVTRGSIGSSSLMACWWPTPGDSCVRMSENCRRTFVSDRPPSSGAASADTQLTELRQWESISPRPPHRSTSNDSNKPGCVNCHEFTLVSYNTLSQRLLHAHPELYSGASSHDCQWRVRSPLIWRQILHLNADIVCLQEVEESDLTSFWLPLCHQAGYELRFKCRTGGRKSDGCAILWRRSAFSAVHIEPVELRRPNCSVLDRDNVALIAHFRSLLGGGDVVISTTHLLFNQRRSDVRLAQSCYLMAAIHELTSQSRQRQQSGPSSCDPSQSLRPLPLVLCGDFNLQPLTPVYRFLCGDRVRFAGTSRVSLLSEGTGRVLTTPLFPATVGLDARCRYQHDNFGGKECEDSHAGHDGSLQHALGRLYSVYNHEEAVDTRREVTTYQDEWITVDYIFYNTGEEKNDGACLLRPLSRLQLPTASFCQYLNPYPSNTLPSDHLPLAVRFALQPTSF